MTIKKKRIESLKDWISIAFFVAMCVLTTCAFGSCSTAHNVEAQGRTVIVTTDTTVVNHNGYIKIQK
jgi:hypothetical protein